MNILLDTSKRTSMYRFIILLLVLMTFNNVHGQGVYLDFKLVASEGYTAFEGKNAIHPDNKHEGANIAISASAQVYKKLHIRSTIASNNIVGQLYLNNNGVNELSTRIAMKQYVVEFLPELRFFKNDWLFINAGMGHKHLIWPPHLKSTS